MKTDKIINKISKIRVENNKCWMKILKIAFKHSPEEAGKIMNKITENDKKVSALSAELGKPKKPELKVHFFKEGKKENK